MARSPRRKRPAVAVAGGQSEPQPLPPHEDRFLTREEAARLLRISVRTLQDLEDGPPFTRAGDRRVIYRLSALLAWEERRRVLPKGGSVAEMRGELEEVRAICQRRLQTGTLPPDLAQDLRAIEASASRLLARLA